MSIPGVEQSEIDRNMRKKHFIVFTMWFYVAGIEYGLVFSSINSYLQKLGAAPFYLGFALAAFPLSGLLLATLMGRFTDRMRKIRPTLLIGVSCSVLGNLLYFSIQNKNVTVVARFMCGIGNSIDGAVMGYSGLLNDSSKRASTFAILLITKQVGTIMVPLWAILIVKIQGFIQPSYPPEACYGFFLAFAWSTIFILALILLRNESRPSFEQNSEELQDSPLVQSTPDSTLGLVDNFLPTYVNEPFVVAIITTFSTIFLQASMETMVTPFNRSYFGWSNFENALEFMMIGICALAGYTLVKYTAVEVLKSDGTRRKRLDTKFTFMIGIIGCYAVSFMNMLVISHAQFRELWLYVAIFTSIIIFCICLPLSMVSSAAIIAKNTPEDFQSSTQSVRVACEKMAQVLGPIWVSSWVPAETRGITGVLIMFPSVLFFTFNIGALYSCWKYL